MSRGSSRALSRSMTRQRSIAQRLSNVCLNVGVPRSTWHEEFVSFLLFCFTCPCVFRQIMKVDWYQLQQMTSPLTSSDLLPTVCRHQHIAWSVCKAACLSNIVVGIPCQCYRLTDTQHHNRATGHRSDLVCRRSGRTETCHHKNSHSLTQKHYNFPRLPKKSLFVFPFFISLIFSFSSFFLSLFLN